MANTNSKGTRMLGILFFVILIVLAVLSLAVGIYALSWELIVAGLMLGIAAYLLKKICKISFGQYS